MMEYLKVCDKCIFRKTMVDKTRKQAEQLLQKAKRMRLSCGGEVMAGSKVVALGGKAPDDTVNKSEMASSTGKHLRVYRGLINRRM